MAIANACLCAGVVTAWIMGNSFRFDFGIAWIGFRKCILSLRWIGLLAQGAWENSAKRSRAQGFGISPRRLFVVYDKRCKTSVGDDARIVPHDGPCRVCHAIMTHTLAGAQCAPLRSLWGKIAD